MTKRFINVSVGYVDIEGITLGKLVEQAPLWIKQYGEHSTIDLEQAQYDNCYSIVLNVKREETDKEYAARMEQEAHVREQQDAYDLAQYNRLKARFENKVV